MTNLTRRIRARSRGVAAAVSLLSCLPQVAHTQDGVCFTTRDAPLYVLQQAPPPRTDKGPSAYFPASAFATSNLDAIERTTSSAELYYWQWSNHGERPRHKANIIPRAGGPLQLVANFSSRSLADDCTIAQTRAALGENVSHATLKLQAYGDATAVEQTDVCYLPTRITRPIAGVLLDYEVFDGRSAEETRDFLVRYAQTVKARSRKVILFTNPLDAPSQSRTGIAASTMGDISAAYDLVTILLWGRNKQSDVRQSFTSQQQILGSATKAKALVTFELASTTMDDARFVHELLQKREVAGVNLWRNYARQGGDCSSESNRKIACLVFGRCE